MDVLFTGAGFSKNFGGFLADEMWSIIFNNPSIQRRSKVKQLMLDDYDYELIYHKVNNDVRSVAKGGFSIEDKRVLNESIIKAYKILDEKIIAFGRKTPSISNSKFSRLLNDFAGNRNKESYFFTLNQDLLIERFFRTNIDSRPFNYLGGITMELMLNGGASTLTNENYIRLPKDSDISKDPSAVKEFKYIKLHGSYNWRSYDGSNMMVLGANKINRIIKEPLLKYYYKFFKETISRVGVKLFVIGYSFRDDHINSVIANAIKKSQLQLYVLAPQQPTDFWSMLMENSKHGNTIYNGLHGYYPYDLTQVFANDGTGEEEYKIIKNSFFNIC